MTDSFSKKRLGSLAILGTLFTIFILYFFLGRIEAQCKYSLDIKHAHKNNGLANMPEKTKKSTYTLDENEEFKRLVSFPKEEIDLSIIADKSDVLCKVFIITEPTSLHVEVNRSIKIVFPGGDSRLVKRPGDIISFKEKGTHHFEITPGIFRREYKIKIFAEKYTADSGDAYKSTASVESDSAVEDTSSNMRTLANDVPPDSVIEINSEWSYRNTEVPFAPADLFPERQDPYLLEVLQGSFRKLKEEGYPTTEISASVLEFGDDGDFYYAGIRDSEQKFPASIVKLFWIVALYGKYDANMISQENMIGAEEEFLMVHESSNDAASKILDLVTGTTSGAELEGELLDDWMYDRYSINRFFQSGNYQELNVSQKVFPIEYLQMNEPVGRDLQVRNHNLDNDKTSSEVTRNYLNTFETLRLLYEIEIGKAISNDYSYRIKEFMLHDNSYESWISEPFNSIEGFFGEYLPERVQLMTKVGYTLSYGRQEAAIIYDPETQKKFLLVVFANDVEFSSDESKALSEIAKTVFDAITSRN